MTFKSLNRRYTKLTRKMAAACCGLLLLAACLSGLTDGRAGAAGFDRRPVQGADSTPALQGAAAIASLKERGLYESLRAALSAPGNRRGDYSVISPSLLDEQKLTASDGAFADQFGQSIAVSGSIIVVGAPLKIIGDNFFQGAAYVFEYLDGSWVEVQKLTASDGSRSDQFGQSIAVSGSTIAVGTQEGQGSAYVFERRGGSWVETQKLTASDGAAFGSFGWLVALSGSTIVVSAHGSAIGGNINQGSAHVFERQGGGWVETRKLTASDGEAADFFSYSVAISGSTIAVGTIGDDINGNTNQGSAYVFQP
jgi:hypothetical protein